MSDSGKGWLWKALLEVVLISLGVFLGMAADQYRTNQQNREQAHAALQRFKQEVEANKAAVDAVRDYHVTLRSQIRAHLNPTTRDSVKLQMQGYRPAPLEHTAWDLAIATQALTDIDSQLAYDLTRVYALQQQYLGLTAGMTQAMYLRPPSENIDAFLQSVLVYLDDVAGYLEPGLVKMYGELLPRLDAALRD